MNGRFRFLYADGREVELGTVDELARHIRSGRIQSETLLYDAQSGGWAPARHHASFLAAIHPPTAIARNAPFEAAPVTPPRASAVALTSEVPRVAYSFHEPETVLAEDAVEQLLRERRDGSREETLERSDGVVATDFQSKDWTHWVSNDALARPVVSQPQVLGWEPQAAYIAPAASRRMRRSTSMHVPLIAGAIGLTSLAAVFFLGSDARAVSDATAPTSALAPLAIGRGLLGSSLPIATSSATETAAFDGMLDEMRALESRYGVDQVPTIWLEGRYLADAGRYPEVIRYWVRYGDYVREMQSREGDLFHANLIHALEGEGVTGATLSLRLARSTRTFEEGSPRRDSVYAAMLELSSAAVSLHALLVEHAASIAYEPASSGISRNPVLEAVVESEDVNREMQHHLAAVLTAMERAYGQRISPREELPSALQRGLMLEDATPRP